MKVNFMPVDYDYFDFGGRNHARITGRTDDGKRFCVIDTCDVYFWAILKDGTGESRIKKIISDVGKIKISGRERVTKVEKVELHEKNFLGKRVKALKIFATNYKDLHDIAERLGMREIEKRRGYDLGFVTHYINEKNFVPLQWHEIEGEIIDGSGKFGSIDKGIDVSFCMELKSLKKTRKTDFNPKILAYDIEADGFKIGSGEILMISLVSGDFRKVITWKDFKEKPDYVEPVKDEAELLERFVEIVRQISPDFLVGYFSDGFDLPYIKARAEKNKVRLNLGLDNSRPKFSGGGRRIGRGRISGIVHIDLLKFIRTAYSPYMQSETLSLNEVSREFLGDTKKEFKIKHSSKMDESQLADYVEYNLHDSVLVHELFRKFWPDLSEFTRVMQEPIFDVSRNGMANNVEDFIIHNLDRFDEIPEKRPTHGEIGRRRATGKYEGAFVLEPTPGLYENVSVFDFTSSYGSTIVTYNLSKSTLLEKKEGNSYSAEVSGRRIYFSRKPGFFSEMLKDMIEKRKRYKKELNEKPDSVKQARSNAFKLLTNASYGYLGFFGARYYCREAAAATASFAKKSIKDVIEKIDDSGYRTIYSDTDSIAFLLNGRTEAQTLKFLDELNDGLPGIMELEPEGFFRRGIWVTKRTGKVGAKKKYALLEKKGRLKIRGFETVRRDWCSLARQLQNRVIRLVLEEGNEKKALEYLKEIVRKLKGREFSKDELMIKTQLKKPISEYKAVSPHVIAAKKMKESGMQASEENIIEYYIAETGNKKALVRERVKLADEEGNYDVKYYLEHQILPSVENIFHVFGFEVREVIEGKRQRKLGEF